MQDNIALRDLMATHVAAALVGRGESSLEFVADFAYDFADALLKERERVREPEEA
jgi:hypothetical protein